MPASADELRCSFGGAVPWSLLAEREPGLFVCPYHVRFVRHVLLFSDYVDAAADAVMGAGETTAILYEASRPERRVRRVLDLGCGAGTLALLLAGDADEVIGTDVNPRAVMISRLNAEINGITNVDFRAGDLYAPIAGERFEVIVSQPPYYPAGADSPRQTYLHGGEHGDEIARAVMEGIPDHLAPDGKAFVFASWPIGRERIELPGMRVRQIHSAAPEIPGTCQVLNIIEHSDELD